MVTAVEDLLNRTRRFSGGIGTGAAGVSLSPTATGTENTALARTQRALSILESPAQASRGATESRLNPALGENLRRNLIEQQRLRSNMRAPGTMNPVQYRAAIGEINANQAAINSGVAALNAMREGQVTAAGQRTTADTAVQTQRMQEAGAFDRQRLQGEYGLAGIDAQNEGRIAAATAINPLDAERLRLGRQFEAQFAEQGTPAERLAFGTRYFDALGGQGTLGGLGQAKPAVMVTVTGADGLPVEIPLPPDVATDYGLYTLYTQNPGLIGLPPEVVRANAAALARGDVTPQQLVQAENQRRQQQQAQENQPWTPATERERLINSQRREY